MYLYTLSVLVLTKNIFPWKICILFFYLLEQYVVHSLCLIIFVKTIFLAFYVYLLFLWCKRYRFNMLQLVTFSLTSSLVMDICAHSNLYLSSVHPPSVHHIPGTCFTSSK